MAPYAIVAGILLAACAPPTLIVEDRCRLWNPPPKLQGESQADLLRFAAEARAWSTVAWERCGNDEAAETFGNIASKLRAAKPEPASATATAGASATIRNR